MSEARGLPVLKLADSEKVRPGDAIVAIGHPLGLEDTVSNGLVSAVRQIGDLTALQISAPIAPGSSGGPLLNEHAEVIGVATAILRGGQNLNLGVPAKYIQALLQNQTPVTLAALAAAARDKETKEASEGPPLPKIVRHVPHHELTIWKGCDESALKLIAHGISEAIDVGAPLYNDGNFAACYHVYEGAALDIERRLPKTCKGPQQALAVGRKQASKLDESSAQALGDARRVRRPHRRVGSALDPATALKRATDQKAAARRLHDGQKVSRVVARAGALGQEPKPSPDSHGRATQSKESDLGALLVDGALSQLGQTSVGTGRAAFARRADAVAFAQRAVLFGQKIDTYADAEHAHSTRCHRGDAGRRQSGAARSVRCNRRAARPVAAWPRVSAQVQGAQR